MFADFAPIVGKTEMTVSNKIKILLEYGLIEIKEVSGNGKKYINIQLLNKHLN